MLAEKNLILVIDDDPAVRASLKFALELDGLPVCTCAGGAELLSHPELGRAGCLVLDHKMPGMDGFEVIGALAAREIMVPVIMITATTTGDIHRRAKRAGVFSVLEKPLLDNTLLDNVRKAVRI